MGGGFGFLYFGSYSASSYAAWPEMELHLCTSCQIILLSFALTCSPPCAESCTSLNAATTVLDLQR